MKYRKKPVVVEAIRASDALHASMFDWDNAPAWLRDAYERGDVLFVPAAIKVNTLEGTMTAGRDDWIIRGFKGELYPCKPDIFAATYEPVG